MRVKSLVGHLALKEVATVVRMAKDKVAEVRHHTQLSPGNCVASMNLRHPTAQAAECLR